MALALVIRRLAVIALALCFMVVVLGAYVRLTDAGLACPDWPGCYGAPSPLGLQAQTAAQSHFAQTPLNVGKAWREMTHRYAAGTLGLLIAALAALALLRRGRQIVGARFACALFAILLLQASLGMLTVTWQLAPLIVTLHLLFGMTTLALLAWLWLTLRGVSPAAHATLPRRLALAALIGLALQIALGGWTSSHYAAPACPDFPTCQGEWWPPMDFARGFALWSGLRIDYAGGVLAVPARTAIHLAHRLGACAATLLLVAAALVTLRSVSARAVQRAAWLVLVFLTLQLLIAVAMVQSGFPLLLASAHNAGAALLLLATLGLYHALSQLPAGTRRSSG